MRALSEPAERIQWFENASQARPLFTYKHGATFEDRDLDLVYIHMYGFDIGDSGIVIAVLVVGIDLKVW